MHSRLKPVLAILMALALILSACGSTSVASAPEVTSPAVPSLIPDGSPASLLTAQSTPAELTAVLGSTHIPQVAPAVSPGGHLYSYAGTNVGAGSMTGAQRTKTEQAFKSQAPGTICGGPIYQPMWLDLAAGGAPRSTWVEMGTAHWCDGSRSWYAFAGYQYGQPGGWSNFYLNQPISGTTTHTMTIHRNANNCQYWAFVIDSTLMNQVQMPGCYVGNSIESGLESYSNWAVIGGPGTMSYNINQMLWNGANTYWWQAAYLNYSQVHAPQMRLRWVLGNNYAITCQNYDPC